MTTVNPSGNSDESYSSYEEIDKSELTFDGSISNDEAYLLVNNDDDDDNNDNGAAATYEEAFQATGFGKWQFLLLLQCGWANASDAMEIMCISLTISSLRESLKLSSQQLTWLVIVLFLGMMVGGYLWGTLADSWGRRQIVIFSLAINGIFGVGSAFARSYHVILVLRFFSGIGAGGSLPVCFSYFSEFQPKEKRGAMISALATFWMAGNLLTAGLGYAILPSERNLHSISPFGQPWRFFIIMCAVPSISSSLFFILMPESPKFLMQKGRNVEALNVLKRVFMMNHPNKAVFPYSKIVSERHQSIFKAQKCENPSLSYSQLYVHHLRYGDKRLHCICRPKRLCYSVVGFFVSILDSIKHQVMAVCAGAERITSVMMVVIYFCIAFSGYSVSMWLPTLMEKAEAFSGSPCAAHNMSHQHKNATAQVYLDVLIDCAAQLPANIFTILVIDITGGKIILIISFIASGVSVLFMWLVKNKLQVVIMGAVFNAFSTMVWNALDVVTPEMYETSVRASASGFLTAISRIASVMGNVIFGLYVEEDCSVPILNASIVLFIGGVASFFIPNTKHITLK
uniref:Synaptic vesicle glycoprotein 2C-like n=1 Tax=Phallusia mammillata TaxID=59560 RepID=A0A6F9DUM8_9ASCI|nr:synaptic vesicle glycoprotein 2C-like [Phallusia mammillata]